MAKVLVATYTNMPGAVLDSFRQGLVDALVANGNQVLLLKSNDLISNWQTGNTLLATVDRDALRGAITQFAPDLIISLNNSGLYGDLLKFVDCPIAVWLMDGPSYLVDKEEFRRQCNRYYVFTPVKAYKKELESEFGFDSGKVHYLPFCSDFHYQVSQTVQNICFVGTYFRVGKLSQKLIALTSKRSEWLRFIQLLRSYKENRDMLWSERLQKYRLESVFSGDSDETWILNTLAINNRVKTLDAIQDLGLTIYGDLSWLEAASYSIDLAMSFHPQPVLTRADLESIYNTSNIAFNISHAQARGGLPWRVFDAMACGAALVSNSEDDLKDLFPPGIEIPTYNSPAEARQVCQDLLSNDTRRLELVRSSNETIEKSHRFKHRLATIGEIFSLELLPGGKGKVTLITSDMLSKAVAPQHSTGTGSNGSNSGKIQFPIEVFYSKTLEFGPSKRISVTKQLAPGEEVAVNFDMQKAAPFLRLDLGMYFSTHEHPKISILKLGSNSDERHELDFERDLLAKNQFAFENGRLICGFDSYCIFRNPFEGEDISICFQSKLTSGI